MLKNTFWQKYLRTKHRIIRCFNFNTRTDEKLFRQRWQFYDFCKNNDALRFVKQKFDRITYSVKPKILKIL